MKNLIGQQPCTSTVNNRATEKTEPQKGQHGEILRDENVPFKDFLPNDGSILASWRRALRQQTWTTMAIFQPTNLHKFQYFQFDEYYIKLLARLEIGNTLTNTVKANTYQVAISEMNMEMDALAAGLETPLKATDGKSAAEFWGARPNLPTRRSDIRRKKVLLLADSGANIYKTQKYHGLKAYMAADFDEWKEGIFNESQSGASYEFWLEEIKKFTTLHRLSIHDGKLPTDFLVIIIDNLNCCHPDPGCPCHENMTDFWENKPISKKAKESNKPRRRHDDLLDEFCRSLHIFRRVFYMGTAPGWFWKMPPWTTDLSHHIRSKMRDQGIPAWSGMPFWESIDPWRHVSNEYHFQEIEWGRGLKYRWDNLMVRIISFLLIGVVDNNQAAAQERMVAQRVEAAEGLQSEIFREILDVFTVSTAPLSTEGVVVSGGTDRSREEQIQRMRQKVAPETSNEDLERERLEEMVDDAENDESLAKALQAAPTRYMKPTEVNMSPAEQAYAEFTASMGEYDENVDAFPADEVEESLSFVLLA